MKASLVTGSNRGIGLELCRQLSARGEQVIAACRTTSPELASLDVSVVDGIDVGEAASLEKLSTEVRHVDLDTLFLNAGIMEREGFDELDEAAYEGMRHMFEVNSIAPLRLAHALVGRLGRGSKIAIVTSLMGSMSDNGSGGYYGYRMSKAAVNAAGVSLARDLADQDIAVGLLHPGMVATEMTGGRGISVEESVRGLLARVAEFGPGNTGRLWHQDGRELAW